MLSLMELPEGKMGEIIDLKNENLVERFGAHVGMTALVLRHAVESLVQIGTQQLELPQEVMGQILVKEI